MNRLSTASHSSDWKVERKVRRRRERALPPGLRADVQRVRRDDLAQVALDKIDERLQHDARGDQLLETQPKVEITPVLARKLLKALDCNPEFRGFIRNEINVLLRAHHIMKTDPTAAKVLPDVQRPAPQPTGGLLPLRSSIGLGTASYLEAEPEEWCQYVLINALARSQASELDDEVTFDDITFDNDTLRIFAIGAGPGGIARAVTALELPVRAEVSEYDYVLAGATAMPCVHGARELSSEKHDVVVFILPSAAEGGAANQRRIYWRQSALENDPSTYGPKRWLAYVAVWLAALPALMTPAGEVFMLVPTSVRCGSGYRLQEDLLESVLRAINAANLQVVEQLRVLELEPVNQPFVGRNRPERWSLRVRRRSPSTAVEAGDA